MKNIQLSSMKDRIYYDAESAKIVHKWNEKWSSFISREFNESENKFKYLLTLGEAATHFFREAKLSDATIIKFERTEFKREVEVQTCIFRFYYEGEVLGVRVYTDNNQNPSRNKIIKIATYPVHIFTKTEEAQILLDLFTSFQMHRFADDLANILLEMSKSGGNKL